MITTTIMREGVKSARIVKDEAAIAGLVQVVAVRVGCQSASFIGATMLKLLSWRCEGKFAIDVVWALSMASS